MVWAFFKNNLLWSQGWQIVLVCAMVAALSFVIYPRLLYVVAAFFIFSVYFFRNPERECPQALQDASVLICPADGKVVDVAYSQSGEFDGYNRRISIFLSPFDVHVNWVPCDGIIDAVNYRTGTFKMAFLPKSSEFNERNDIVIKKADGTTFIVRQIAGTIARRICCWVTPGQAVSAGYKYGMIRFGSRVDILLPERAYIDVEVGQRVYGGQTVLGKLGETV